MSRAWALALCGLVLLSCAGAQVAQSCSDKAFVALTAECAAAAVSCRQQGGTEDECGTVCDAKADDWAKRCGK